jgi:hypothetical protein
MHLGSLLGVSLRSQASEMVEIPFQHYFWLTVLAGRCYPLANDRFRSLGRIPTRLQALPLHTTVVTLNIHATEGLMSQVPSTQAASLRSFHVPC